MANFVRFQMVSGDVVPFSKSEQCIKEELNESTVKNITVEGDPWVFFQSHNYAGDFIIYNEGKGQKFPTNLQGGIIKSVRRVKGGIDSSKVTLYPQAFFEGTGQSFQRETHQIQGTYFSLKVDNGAVIFFDDENYKGGKRILLKGDEVQNYTAVKLTSIGKSMKTAGDMGL